MRFRFLIITTLTAVFACSAAEAHEQNKKGWIPLLNGKDLKVRLNR